MTMSDFSPEAARKALELCFQHFQQLNIEEALDYASKLYYFMMGESPHFKGHKQEYITFDSIIQEFIKTGKPVDIDEYLTEQIERKKKDESSLVKHRLNNALIKYKPTPLQRLRAYEERYGKFDPNLDHLL